MIDFTLYDFLERIVNEQDEQLRKYQEIYSSGNGEPRVGINAVQSIIRRSVVDTQKEDPAYSWISYGKEGYKRVKPSNLLKFDFNFILAILSNVPGIIICDKWAIIMVILTIFAQLQNCKDNLSPAMGIIVMFLHDNGYEKKKKLIQEESLKEKMVPEIEKQIEGADPRTEFDEAIKGLEKLKIIQIQEGNIELMEEVKI